MAFAEYLECGKAINTHGIKGVIKLESYCDTPKILSKLPFIYIKANGSFRKFRVIHASVQKQFVLAKLEGIDTVESAESLRGTVFFADRNDLSLDEGAFFIADLIGLPVADAENGKVYGKLKDIINEGASDIYVIKTAAGDAMIPAVPEFVKSIDPESRILISPIPGMFD